MFVKARLCVIKPRRVERVICKAIAGVHSPHDGVGGRKVNVREHAVVKLGVVQGFTAGHTGVTQSVVIKLGDAAQAIGDGLYQVGFTVLIDIDVNTGGRGYRRR